MAANPHKIMENNTQTQGIFTFGDEEILDLFNTDLNKVQPFQDLNYLDNPFLNHANLNGLPALPNFDVADNQQSTQKQIIFDNEYEKQEEDKCNSIDSVSTMEIVPCTRSMLDNNNKSIFCDEDVHNSPLTARKISSSSSSSSSSSLSLISKQSSIAILPSSTSQQNVVTTNSITANANKKELSSPNSNKSIFERIYDAISDINDYTQLLINLREKNPSNTDRNIELIKEYAPRIINDIVLSSLYDIAQAQPFTVIDHLLSKADHQVVNTALLIKKYLVGSTVIQLLAQLKSIDVMFKVLNIASDDTIQQAITTKNVQGNTAFHDIVVMCSADIMQLLLSKVNDSSLKKALTITNKQGDTPLHVIAKTRSSAIMLALLSRLSRTTADIIQEPLIILDKRGYNAFYYIVERQSSAVMLQLLTSMNDEFWKEFLMLQSNYFFHYLLINKSKDVLRQLIPLLWPYQQAYLFAVGQEFSAMNNNIVIRLDSAFYEVFREDKLLSDSIVELLDMDKIGDKLQSKKNIPLTARLYFTQMLAALQDDSFFEIMKTLCALGYLPEKTLKLLEWNNKHDNSKSIDLQQEFRQINFYQQNLQQQLCLLLIMARLDSGLFASMNYNVLYRSIGIKASNFYKQLSSVPEVQIKPNDQNNIKCQDLLSSNNLLIKIITEDRWSEYITQLQDPSKRNFAIRASRSGGYKFVHLSGEIIEYKKKPPDVSKNSIKKNSTTLLTQTETGEVWPNVFGRHRDRCLVGLLFDKKLCNIKAMLTGDFATYNHAWIGSKKQVIDYANNIRTYCYFDEDSFVAAIKGMPNHNEVLAETNKEAIIALVVCRGNILDLYVARARQKELVEKLNIEVPIFCYQSGVSLQIYTDEMQEYDLHGEETARDQLLKLHENWIATEWKVKKNIFSFFEQNNPSLAIVQAICTSIKRAMVKHGMGDNKRFLWTDLLIKVQNTLVAELAKPELLSPQVLQAYQEAVTSFMFNKPHFAQNRFS